MNHIFGNSRHGLQQLIDAVKTGEDTAVRIVIESLRKGHFQTFTNSSGQTGVFNVERMIQGIPVTITGRVIDGALKVSDFWVKEGWTP